MTETIPCATIGPAERENNEIWLVRFYSDNRTNDESRVSRQAHAPQTLSKVNPRKAMVFQMLEIKSIFPQLIDDIDSRVIKMKIKNGEHL